MSVATLVQRQVSARVQYALRGRARILRCATARELRSVVSHEDVCAVVTEPFDSARTPIISTVASIREAHPSIPILLCCRLDADSVRQVLPLARAGIDELIIEGTDDLVSAIKLRLEQAEEHCVAREVLCRVGPHVPPTLHSLLSFCLFNASRKLTVDSLAHAFQVDRKTLARRLKKEHWPAPAAVLAWSRVLLVAHLIERQERPVDQIALSLDYASGSALRNTLRRYVGLSPHEIRESGGLECVLHAFVAALLPDPVTDAPRNVIGA